MSDKPVELFCTTPNYYFSEYQLARMERFRLALLAIGSEDPSDNITDLLNYHSNNGSNNAVFEIIDAHGVDYTLIACLSYEASEAKDLARVAEFCLEKIRYFGDSVARDLIAGGISLVWRSIGIRDEEIKKKTVKSLIPDLLSGSGIHRYAFGDADKAFMHVTRSIIQGHSDFKHEDFLHKYSKIDFLLNNNPFKRIESCEFAEAVPDKDKSLILFSWVLPLCHMAYLEGVSANKIMSQASEIIEGLADACSIKDVRHRSLFKRRCLAHIAMGFKELMSEISITKEDMRPLSSRDHEGFMLEMMEHIRLSPASVFPVSDYLSTIVNDKELLLHRNIHLGLDEYMEIEKSKLYADISLLGAHAQIDDSLIFRAIDHPEWLKVPNVMLASTNVVSYSPDPDPDSALDSNIDIQIAILKRQAMGLVTHPLPCKKWSRKEQKQIVSTLSAEGLFNESIYNLVRPDADILLAHKDKIPSSIKRQSVETDIGL